MFDLAPIQDALREFGLDGWFLYDFRGSNVLARRVLDLEGRTVGSRRLAYFIPATGEATRLVHRIEPAALDHLPGAKRVYLRWQEFESGVMEMVGGARRVALEYSPRNAIPYLSRVDAGTVELIRAAGAEPVSSGDLIQRFESCWDDAQWALHREADRHTQSAYDVAFGLIAERCRDDGGTVRETEVQAAIMDHFARNGLTTYHPPIVGANAHAGDPHYEPVAGADAAIRRGDLVLVDLWAKMDRPRAVYSDLTRMGYVGTEVPEEHARLFAIVAAARDAAIERVRSAFAAGTTLHGWEVDRAARDVIERAGYGPQFVHRTGHSIGQETHGNGANMDDLETRDDRLVLPRSCFSVEPGLYFDDMGFRSEVNVFVDADRQVHVTGGLQQAIYPLLADRSTWR
jgi:Xaa-Pro aminopeptidase